MKRSLLFAFPEWAGPRLAGGSVGEVMMPLLHHHDGPQAPWVLILVDAEDESF